MFSFEHVNRIRAAEVEKIAAHLPAGGRILEIGAGSGQQAKMLAERRFRVDAIEVPSSAYRDRVFPVAEYDGRAIPFPDQSFDAVFSSNVLEHVRDLAGLFAEMRRVLKRGGIGVHVMPTHAWRFWTSAALIPAALQAAWLVRRQLPSRSAVLAIAKQGAPIRHGERGNIVSEHWLFRPAWWRRTFAENGFAVVSDEPMGLFYTGTMLLGARLSFAARERLASRLGSACHLFTVKPK